MKSSPYLEQIEVFLDAYRKSREFEIGVLHMGVMIETRNTLSSILTECLSDHYRWGVWQSQKGNLEFLITTENLIGYYVFIKVDL